MTFGRFRISALAQPDRRVSRSGLVLSVERVGSFSSRHPCREGIVR